MSKVLEFTLRQLVDEDAAAYFRRIATLMEEGKVTSYAFIAEDIEHGVEFSYVGNKRSHVLGLIARLAHILNKAWDRDLL